MSLLTSSWIFSPNQFIYLCFIEVLNEMLHVYILHIFFSQSQCTYSSWMCKKVWNGHKTVNILKRRIQQTIPYLNDLLFWDSNLNPNNKIFDQNPSHPQCLKKTLPFLVSPPPTRWTTQRANDRYKDHLYGQFTNKDNAKIC